jgi:hypothetical protein
LLRRINGSSISGLDETQFSFDAAGALFLISLDRCFVELAFEKECNAMESKIGPTFEINFQAT